ncbi:MAG: glycosyltransferase 87 family protein, partial [Dehalobacter sp.]|nr:glycosyltransferase 87 family protein [Dehalobacter sp.]
MFTIRLGRQSSLLFFMLRSMFFLALPLAGLIGYGDLPHFFNLSKLGWPYFDFWSEFPPLFPFLSRLLFLASGGQEHVYDYLLVFLLTLFQAGNLALFIKLNRKLHPGEGSEWRLFYYFSILLVLSYGWWYFDPLAVFFMLSALLWILEGKDRPAGVAIGLGILTKLFPGFVLIVAWLIRPKKRALQTSLIAISLVLVVYGALYRASPEMTTASLRSQAGKGSWETAWALLDGNLNTGNFGELVERFDPQAAGRLVGNPPVLPAWLALVPFALLGAWLFFRFRPSGPF